jgi:hypothetical protein
VSQSVSKCVCLGVEPTLGLVTWYYFLSEGYCLKVVVLFLWGALSDKRIGMQFALQSLDSPSHAEPVTVLHCLIWDSPNLEGQVPVLISPRNRVAQLYPLALGEVEGMGILNHVGSEVQYTIHWSAYKSMYLWALFWFYINRVKPTEFCIFQRKAHTSCKMSKIYMDVYTLIVHNQSITFVS